MTIDLVQLLMTKNLENRCYETPLKLQISNIFSSSKVIPLQQGKETLQCLRSLPQPPSIHNVSGEPCQSFDMLQYLPAAEKDATD